MSALANLRSVRTLYIQHSVKINAIIRKYSQNFPDTKTRHAKIFENIKYSNCVALQVRTFAINADKSRNRNSIEPVKPTLETKEGIVEVNDNIDSVIEISKQYPNPKNVLNNFYDNVARQLSKNDFKISSAFKLIKRTRTTNNWSCTIHVKWPEDMKFTRIATHKQEASLKATLDALLWLKQINRIDNAGQPLIYNAQETKEIKNSRIPLLKLTEDEQEGMKDLLGVYQNQLLPKLNEYYENKSHETEDSNAVEDYEKMWPKTQQSHFQDRSVSYRAQEPVKLPISDFKSNIKRLIDEKRVVIVKGEPGCGKSTRVPQYVLEYLAEKNKFFDGPNRIIVTQPRRIAAISLADRVSNEREEELGHTVGFQVRLQSRFNNTIGKIMYCTTGILLRRIQSDPNLTDCSYVILDEAHERDVNTDLLLNLLRHSLKANPNLKLIVMSATIDTDIFQKYFEDAATIHIPGFTYPVKVNFLEDIKDLDLTRTKKMTMEQGPNVVCEDVVKVINKIHQKGEEGAILCFLPGWEEIMKVNRLLPVTQETVVLCLHSRMQDSDQNRIFKRVPPGVRKIILATNIAETSVTIDDVVHVIDTGIHKEQRFDAERGIMCMDNHWISKASMTQRKGRAGRVQKGISYHMYPKAKFESFQDYTMPEILRTSLTKIVLDSKVYSNNMDAVEFFEQLPCSPGDTAIEKALEELKELELLDDRENLTPLGRTVSNFQLEPKLSKAMVNSVVFQCATPIVDITTLYSADTEIFEGGLIDKEGVKNTKKQYSKTSDHLSMMRLLENWLNNQEHSYEICSTHSLAQHKLRTMAKLRKIHFDYLLRGLKNNMPISDNFSDCDELVLGTLLSGVGNVLTHRTWDITKGRLKNTNVLVTKDNHKATISSESVHYKRGHFSSNYFVYINETRSNIRRTTIVREASLISPLTMLLFKNSKLYMKELPSEAKSGDENGDKVLLRLEGTRIETICTKEQAKLVLQCKEAINSGVVYFVEQLTEGNNYDSEINSAWHEILERLSKILEK